MTSLNLADMLALFLSVIGPQKVLLSFARIAQTLDAPSVRRVAVVAAVASAGIGFVCAQLSLTGLTTLGVIHSGH